MAQLWVSKKEQIHTNEFENQGVLLTIMLSTSDGVAQCVTTTDLNKPCSEQGVVHRLVVA